MLTEGQIASFRAFGFLVFRGLFDAREQSILDAEFMDAFAAAYPDAAFDGTARHWALMTTPRTPFMASLLEDSRFVDVAEQLYGPEVLGIACDASRLIGETIWHPDTSSFDHSGVKFVFYLQPLRGERGALRLIPASHTRPLYDQVNAYLKIAHPAIGDVPAYIFESEPGDVIAYDLRAWHASTGGGSDRRHGSLFYFNDPRTPAEHAALQAQHQFMGQAIATLCATRPVRVASVASGSSETTSATHPVFDARWLANEGGSARRARWIRRLGELGFLEPADLGNPSEDRLPHPRNDAPSGTERQDPGAASTAVVSGAKPGAPAAVDEGLRSALDVGVGRATSGACHLARVERRGATLVLFIGSEEGELALEVRAAAAGAPCWREAGGLAYSYQRAATPPSPRMFEHLGCVIEAISRILPASLT